MRVIVDGYKNPEQLFNQMLESGCLKDEAESHEFLEKVPCKRIIITPWHLWDYTQVYGDKSTDCVLSSETLNWPIDTQCKPLKKNVKEKKS